MLDVALVILSLSVFAECALIFFVTSAITKNETTASYIVSFFHALSAVMMAIASYDCTSYGADLYDEVWPSGTCVNGKVLYIYCYIGLGYFVYDLIGVLTMKDVKRIERILFVIHHVIAISLIGKYISMVKNLEYTYPLLSWMLLMTETSTVFTDINHVLTSYTPKCVILRSINGFILMVTFLGSRLIGIPYAYYTEGFYNHHDYTDVFMTVLLCTLTCFNLYFGYKIVKGFFSFICNDKGQGKGHKKME